jgi:hypothetical protein
VLEIVDELILQAFANARNDVDATVLDKWYIISNPQGAEQAVWDPYLLLGLEAGPRRTCVSFFASSDTVENVDSSRLMVEGADDLTDQALVTGCSRSTDLEWLSRFILRLIEWTIHTPGVSWAQIEQELSSGA